MGDAAGRFGRESSHTSDACALDTKRIFLLLEWTSEMDDMLRFSAGESGIVADDSLRELLLRRGTVSKGPPAPSLLLTRRLGPTKPLLGHEASLEAPIEGTEAVESACAAGAEVADVLLSESLGTAVEEEVGAVAAAVAATGLVCVLLSIGIHKLGDKLSCARASAMRWSIRLKDSVAACSTIGYVQMWGKEKRKTENGIRDVMPDSKERMGEQAEELA